MALKDTILDLAAECGAEKLNVCEAAVEESFRQQRSAVTRLFDDNLISEDRFVEGLARRLEYEFWAEALPAPARSALSLRVALRYQLYPIEVSEKGLYLLTYDPFNLAARQAVAHALKMPFTWCLCSRRKILQGLRQGYGIGADTFDQIMQGRELDDSIDSLQQETNVLDAEEDSEASVVKFVNQIIREALEERATDIHVEPLEDDLQIRYRIDGVLHNIPVPDRIKDLQASVISRLKIMAHLDIAERRLPQDGRINLEFEGEAIDVRVATIPSVSGESVSLRLLGQEKFNFELLRLDEKHYKIIQGLLAMPNGIVLITGPTGSGKSTTLYTLLSSLNTKERRIVTIEDPVEHKLPGVIQIPVKPEINLTFAAGLRSILRGDPNVIMLGEMRDLETAEIAIRAALTGHLVFSTLHTNDSIGGITRLIDMGVEPFLVASSVRAFIAQRLVRRLCPRCRQPANHSPEKLAEIGFPQEFAHTIMRNVGCEDCRNTGYQGRMAVYEICVVTSKMQDMITQRKPATLLRPLALEEGMVPLRNYCYQKVIEGATTLEEVLRVTLAESEG